MGKSKLLSLEFTIKVVHLVLRCCWFGAKRAKDKKSGSRKSKDHIWLLDYHLIKLTIGRLNKNEELKAAIHNFIYG